MPRPRACSASAARSSLVAVARRRSSGSRRRRSRRRGTGRRSRGRARPRDAEPGQVVEVLRRCRAGRRCRRRWSRRSSAGRSGRGRRWTARPVRAESATSRSLFSNGGKERSTTLYRALNPGAPSYVLLCDVGRTRAMRTVGIAGGALAVVLLAAACGNGDPAPRTAPWPDPEPLRPPSASALVGARTLGLGRVLVDAFGRTLYVFEGDAPGRSACAGDCLRPFPPLLTHGRATPGRGVKASLLARPYGGTARRRSRTTAARSTSSPETRCPAT